MLNSFLSRVKETLAVAEESAQIYQAIFQMKCNIGKIERMIWIAAGLVLAAAGIFSHGIWPILGVAVMVSAFIAWCPVRVALGLSSCLEEEKLSVDTSAEHNERKPQNLLFGEGFHYE